MRRLYQIFTIIFAVFFVVLCLYAFVDPMRAWMQTNIGPTVLAIFGGIIVGITTSPIWLHHVAPTLNAWLIGLAMGIFPISFPMIHRTFNWYRAKHVQSADRESGHILYKEPISSPSRQTESPAKTKSESPPVKTEPTPAPQEEKSSEGGEA